MCWKRRFGSFFSVRLMTISRSCGNGAPVTVPGFGGSSRSTDAIVDIVVEPWKARRPVAIS